MPPSARQAQLRHRGMLFVLAALALVFPASRIGAQSNRWMPIGPETGTVLAMERRPGEPSVVLAGTYFGGLYRSHDYGFTWTHVHTVFSTQSVFALAIAPSAPDTVYAGTFQSGVYRSSDGGTTWEARNTGLVDTSVQAITVDPASSTTVLAATTNSGIFRSTDGGDLWTRVDVSDHPLRGRSFAWDTTEVGVLYLATVGEGVWCSSDSGQSWTRFSAGMTAPLVLALRTTKAQSGAVYAATTDGAYKLRPGTSSWSPITGNLPALPLSDIYPHPTIANLVLAASPAGIFLLANDEQPQHTWQMWSTLPTRLLASDPSGFAFHAALVSGGLFGTTSFGANWINASRGMQNLFVGALEASSGPTGPTLWAGSDQGVHKLGPHGWQRVFHGEQGIFDIQADPTNANVLYLGSERGGVYRSIDAGVTWTTAARGMLPAQVYQLGQSADGSALFAATSSGLFQSTDGSATWFQPPGPATASLALTVAPDPTRAPLLFVGGTGGRVYFSQNGGTSFSDASGGLPNENITRLRTAPWEKTYAITASGLVYATSDNGLNWFRVATSVGYPALALDTEPERAWVLYLATGGGGVYKSESAGLSWTTVNSGLADPYIYSIAVDASAPSTVYAGGVGRIFKSTDGAETWTPASEGLPLSPVISLLVDAADDGTIYATLQDASLFRSTNHGISWMQVGAGLPSSGLGPLQADRLAPGTLYAGSALYGVFKSIDRGMSWTASGAGMTLFVRGLAIDPSRSSTLYAGSLGAGVFRSYDSGTTWTNQGLRDVNIFKLAVDPSDTRRVYAATSRGVHASIDSGETWRALSQPTAFANAIVGDPLDEQMVYVGAPAGKVHRTMDGGHTWETGAQGLPLTTIHALAIDNQSGALYASPERNGVYRSTDRGMTWTPLQTGGLPVDVFVSSLHVTANSGLFASTLTHGVFRYGTSGWQTQSTGLSSPRVSHMTGDAAGRLYASTFDAGVFRSVDGGTTWSWASVGLTTSLVLSVTPHPSVDGRLFAATADGVFLTNTAGDSWSARRAGLEGVVVRRVAISSGTTPFVIASTNGDGVFVSADEGQTWTRRSSGLLSLDVLGVVAGPTRWYAATLGGGLGLSTDAGASWHGGVTPAFVDSVALALAVDPLTPNRLYAATAGQGVLRSDDRGTTWRPLTNGLDDRFLLSMALDPVEPNRLYAGTVKDGVFASTNAGLTWQPLNDGLFNPVVTALEISVANHRQVFAGTEGGGVFGAEVSLPVSACSFAVSPTEVVVAASGDTLDINVVTGPGCKWSADSPVDWISTKVSGAGSGTATITVVPAEGAQSRSLAIFVAGQPVLLTERGISSQGTADGARTCTVCVERSEDSDRDDLPNLWEEQFGIDAANSTGEHGVGGDPDHDGRTNLDELRDGTHPRGFYRYILADGVPIDGLDSRVTLLNVGSSEAKVWLMFRGSAVAARHLQLPSMRPLKLDTGVLIGVSEPLSIVIESDQPLAVDGLVRADPPIGTRVAAARTAPATDNDSNPESKPTVGRLWAVADGEQEGFDLCDTVLGLTNTSPHAGLAAITQVLEDGTRVARNTSLPALRTNSVALASLFPRRARQSYSVLIESQTIEPHSFAGLSVERTRVCRVGGVSWVAGGSAPATLVLP